MTALAFVLMLGLVERFPRSKEVLSYLGLNPSEGSSGGKQRLGSISKQGNSMMRYLLCEAAQTASRFDPELRRDYQRLRLRSGDAVAKVAIARKLAVRLYWMLRDGARGKLRREIGRRTVDIGESFLRGRSRRPIIAGDSLIQCSVVL